MVVGVLVSTIRQFQSQQAFLKVNTDSIKPETTTRSLGAAFLLILVEQHRKLAKRVV